MARMIFQIAAEIRRDWKKISPYAEHYLNAMDALEFITDYYGADSAVSVIEYFLANASGWRGDVSRRVKTELKQMVKEQRGC